MVEFVKCIVDTGLSAETGHKLMGAKVIKVDHFYSKNKGYSTRISFDNGMKIAFKGCLEEYPKRKDYEKLLADAKKQWGAQIKELKSSFQIES